MPATGDDFLHAVAAHFLKLRGQGMILSPADLEVLARWESQGILAAAAVRGISAAFKWDGEIRSLEQCAWAVAAEVNKSVSRGGTKAPSPAAFTRAMKVLAATLERSAGRRSAAPPLAKAAAEVRRLARDVDAGNSDAPTVLRWLRNIEDAPLPELASRLPQGALERFRADAARSLAGREITPEAARRTQDAIITTMIRRYFDVPRFSF